MTSKKEKIFIVISLCLAILVGSIVFAFVKFYLLAEHKVFETKDPKTGLSFAAVCKLEITGATYWSYIVVKSDSGQEIDRYKLPHGMDMLSDCTKDSAFVVTDIKVNNDRTKLLIHFGDYVPPTEIPFNTRVQ